MPVGSFTIHIFQVMSSLYHTGIILEFTHSVKKLKTDEIRKVQFTQYDFGYGKRLIGATVLKNSAIERHNHLAVEPLYEHTSSNINSVIEKRGYKLLHSIPYKYNYFSEFQYNLPIRITMDYSIFLIQTNNCRDYVLKLLKRLSKNRSMSEQERLVYKEIDKFRFKPKPIIPTTPTSPHDIVLTILVKDKTSKIKKIKKTL